VWAVGDYSSGSWPQTLVEHWDGSVWSVVSSPNPAPFYNYLYGVAAVSANDVWAVGNDSFGGDHSDTLVEHWDGSVWSVVSSPTPGQYNGLNGVAAVSASDVWAVGWHTGGPHGYTLVEHWDGSAWTVVSSPGPGGNSNSLDGVAAVSANDVWAVGDYYNGTIYQTLVEHWDGSTWTVVSSPNVGAHDNHLKGVAAVSANDVRAVGSYNNGTIDQTLVEHWDGSTWSVVPSPNVGTHSNDLYGMAVAPAPSGAWWAVGAYMNDAGISQTLILGPGGVMPSPNVGTHDNGLNAVAAVSASDVWAVGAYNNGTTNQTLVERYHDPCAPTPTPPATPSATPSPSNTPASTPTNTPLPPIATPTSTTTSPSTPAPANTGTSTDTPVPSTNTPTFTPTACTVTFSDVPVGSTFYPFIHCLACLGIISGYPDGSFKPNSDITRGQLSKIVSNSAGFHDAQPHQMFEDVPVGSTFQVYIGRLASRGYISGYPCGEGGEPCVPPHNLPYFRPNNNATRGQISKIDANAAGFSDPPVGQQFEDVAVGSSFYTYTYRLVFRGVMSGYPCGGPREPCVPPANLPYFRPNNNATRGQTAKIVSNVFFPDCQTPAR
jgi:hypothetical protein